MHRLKWCAYLLAVVSCLNSHPSWARADPSSNTVNKSIAEVDGLHEQFQFYAGLNHIDETLQIFPTDPRLHRKRGDVLMLSPLNEAISPYTYEQRMSGLGFSPIRLKNRDHKPSL